jgi:SAM-dependent methyltransferase
MSATDPIDGPPIPSSTFPRRLFQRIGRAVYRAPHELTHCPACGSMAMAALDLYKLPTTIEGHRTGLVSGCEDCGLVFVNPSPSEAALDWMYGPQGEWALARPEEASTAGLHEGKRAKGQWRRLFEPIEGEFDVANPPPASRVLDFGCGRGKFLDVLKPCGWLTYGIEPATDVAFPNHQRLVTIPGEPMFDLVIAHHVLEHVSDPLDLLKRFAAATRMGGYLLVAVPRLDTLQLHRDLGYVVSRVHVRSYTSVCMDGLLRRAGWEMVAPPSDEVTISAGRRTSARLRILARRVRRDLSLPARPLEPAKRALKAYYRQEPTRSVAERLARAGAVRMAARVLESERRIRKTFVVLRARAERAFKRS